MPRPGFSTAPGVLWRSSEIEAECVLLGEAQEVPLVGEGPLVVPAQLVENGAARAADAERFLQQLHQFLVGEPTRTGSRSLIVAESCGQTLWQHLHALGYGTLPLAWCGRSSL
jgi:hypothetical protein